MSVYSAFHVRFDRKREESRTDKLALSWTFSGPDKDRCLLDQVNAQDLSTETVQGAALAFQGVDDVQGGDGLPLGVLGVGDSITDDVLQEHFQYAAGFLVDETRDTLHTTTAGKTTDGWLGDTLDVISQDFSVPLGASLS